MLIVLGFLALALLAVGGYYGGRALRVIITRALDLAERKIAVQEQRTRSPAVPIAIPPDLYRRITRWGSADAQNDERTTLLDLYNEFRDAKDPWMEVRAHLPTEPDDRMTDDIYAGGLVS